MKVFTKKYSVIRHVNEKINFDKQYLVKTLYLFNIPYYKTIIDEEDFPSWASIELGCFGYTNWESKFKEFIKK
jgi:uncharacterized pyridoxamine 5'-phosphate oxidase family protein